MKTVIIPGSELYDESKNEFITLKDTQLTIEHSLISIKKWEERWKVPFLKTEKTAEQFLDYIRCMTINKVDDNVYRFIPSDVLKEIVDYIADPMTATWFSDNETVGAQKRESEIVTAEIIYYWMIALNIPMEFQKWHLNSLLTFIRVVSIKNEPKKKMSDREWAMQRSRLNKARSKHK